MMMVEYLVCGARARVVVRSRSARRAFLSQMTFMRMLQAGRHTAHLGVLLQSPLRLRLGVFCSTWPWQKKRSGDRFCHWAMGMSPLLGCSEPYLASIAADQRCGEPEGADVVWQLKPLVSPFANTCTRSHSSRLPVAEVCRSETLAAGCVRRMVRLSWT